MTGSREGLVKQCRCGKGLPRPERLRVWSKCEHGWHVAGRHNGHKYSVSVDKHVQRKGLDVEPRSLKDVEPFAKDIEDIIRANGGVYVAPTATTTAATANQDGPTVDAAIDRFVAKITGTYDTWTNERGMLTQAADVPVSGVRFGSMNMAAVDETVVEKVFKAATFELSDGTKKKYARVLRNLFGFAASKMKTANPITDDTSFPSGVARKRIVRIPDDIINKLIDAAIVDTLDTRNAFDGQRLADLIVGAKETGGRRGELLAVKWSDIDMEGHQDELWFAAREKGARKNLNKGTPPRFVPVSEAFRVVLNRRRLDPNGKPFKASAYVFGDELGHRVKSVKKAFTTAACRAYGIEPKWSGTALASACKIELDAVNNGQGLWWTDIRHTAAIRWHRDGVELSAIATLLGHADLSMLRIYLGLDSAEAIASYRRVYAPAPPKKSTPKRARTTENARKTPVKSSGLVLVRGKKSA